MKLRPLAIVAFYCPHCGELLSPSSPNSVSDRKKTSLRAGFRYLRLSMTRLQGSSSSRGPCFPHASFRHDRHALAAKLDVDYSNSK